MPVNRNSLLRYQVIDKCLRNRGRKFTWQNILDEVNDALSQENQKSNGIGKTTLYEDLKDIEYRIYHMDIERVKMGKTIFLRYKNPGDSINNQPLSNAEVSQIKTAISVLGRFKGAPQFDWISEIIPIIESKMGLIKRDKEIISFDSNIDYSGAKHIPAIFNAILNKRVLKITYHDFKKPQAFEIEVHPQYLKQYNSRWFMMSLMDVWGDKPQNHPLDRILALEEVGTSYKELIDFDWDDFFSDMIGVTRFNKSPVEVKLLILDHDQARYIETKPMHQSQKPIRKVEGGYETSITVIPNFELEKLILSFGERIKVLSPPDLKKTLKKRIEKLLEQY